MNLGHLVAGLMAVIPVHSSLVTNVSPQGQIEGEIVQVFPSVIVLKNAQGLATVLQLTPRTQLGGPLKPGDKIIAFLTPYGVSSVQLKPGTALVP